MVWREQVIYSVLDWSGGAEGGERGEGGGEEGRLSIKKEGNRCNAMQ